MASIKPSDARNDVWLENLHFFVERWNLLANNGTWPMIFLLKTLPSNTDPQRYTLYSSCKTKVGFGLVQAVRTSLTYNLWEYAELRSRPHPSETRGRIKKGSESHVKFGHLERLQRAIDAEENDKLLELNERYKSNANKSDKSDITSTTESLTSSESSYSKRVLDSDTD